MGQKKLTNYCWNNNELLWGQQPKSSVIQQFGPVQEVIVLSYVFNSLKATSQFSFILDWIDHTLSMLCDI